MRCHRGDVDSVTRLEWIISVTNLKRNLTFDNPNALVNFVPVFGVASAGNVVPAEAVIAFLMQSGFDFAFGGNGTGVPDYANYLVFAHLIGNLSFLMSVYARFKRSPDGFRKLVELLETTPVSRRQKMIEVGMAEDAAYTEKALRYVMDFKDIINLPDMELAEVCAKAPPRMIAFAICQLDEDVKQKFLRSCKPKVLAEVRDWIETKVGLREIGGAQLKVIESARELERSGFVRTKKIPLETV